MKQWWDKPVEYLSYCKSSGYCQNGAASCPHVGEKKHIADKTHWKKVGQVSV